MKKNINIQIDNKNITTQEGQTILEVCRQNNIDIPTLCYDPRISPNTSCFLCVVEIEGMRGNQPACSTKINADMVIKTNTDNIQKARKTALDLLLSNHYADCVAPCKQTCPAGVDVQGYISLIEKGLYTEAVKLIKEANPLPAICGRVCVRPCEVACRRNLLQEGAAAGIDYMKRYVADIDLEDEFSHFKPEIAPDTGKKIAIIGAGPGGLSAAYFLRQNGHQVSIYEASPKPGGMLRYGIPEYRLPNDILDKEVERITEIGVTIRYNQKLGNNLKYKYLKENYDAVILSIGSQKGTLIGCEGDDAENVYSGIEFLRNLQITNQKYDFSGKTVAVVGGGNTAMDCCRTAVRCGAEKTYVIYRRTEKEMPANPIEIHESKLEGINYLFLTNPKKINKDEKGKLKSVTCLKMELGKPDASGRRRPVPIEGSEFDLEVDYILAAIGQKTVVDFLEEINEIEKTDEHEFKLNRWNDIDTHPQTLQTGVPSIFAAGDSVTGPATIIEAIEQAQRAAYSANLFLAGIPVTPKPNEFLSKKENFKQQTPEDYANRFQKQTRQEMLTLPANKRLNFDEVELGYSPENAIKEAQRCLECGCTEYFTCDLKKYSTEYHAEQKNYEGSFHEYKVDFSHPLIEIDNNKCILCGRCIKICSDVVGANALGFINRGFNTYVAPAMGKSLTETDCESCGLCISTCPTGAITENVSFKPGPVQLESFDTISNFDSIGAAITIHHRNNYVMKITGKNGQVNKTGNFSPKDKFGYKYINDSNRITKPMLKKNGKFQEVSFDEAYNIIIDRILSTNPNENAFYAGARLTNEELYLIQKLARAGAKTNNISSFHYIGRGIGYRYNTEKNTPFEELKDASKIYLIGTETNKNHAVINYEINTLKNTQNIDVELITVLENNSMRKKVNSITQVESYYSFIKAAIHYLLTNNLQNNLFINDNCIDFDDYKKAILNENFDELVNESGVNNQTIINFALDYNKQSNAIILFSEKELSSNSGIELFNLAMLTGKLGKTASGIISLKEKNNSQGLFDMGNFSNFGVGNQPIDDENYQKRMQKLWNVNDLPTTYSPNQIELLKSNKLKNIFIFGEDPIGCAIDKYDILYLIQDIDFLLVQDYFMTKTAQKADLILPASFHFESGGSFTNTQKTIQTFETGMKSPIERLAWQQLSDIMKKMGMKSYEKPQEILQETFALLPETNKQEKLQFEYTKRNNFNRVFNFGCDYIEKYTK